MEVSVSIPDPVSQRAELLAQRLSASRSEVYARALDAYVAAHDPDQVTERMNSFVDEVDSASDPFVRAAAHRVLNRVEW